MKLATEGAISNELWRRANLGLEKDRVTKLERQIKSCVVLSPADGKMVYANRPPQPGMPKRIDIEEGANVRERQLLFWVVPEGAAPAKE